MIDLLAGWLSDLGFRTEIQAVSADGSKANLIATLGSGPGGPGAGRAHRYRAI